MEARDAAVKQGARVVRNIRKWWPTLTDHDLRALNAWRWCIGAGRGPEDTTPLFARRSAGRSFHNGVSTAREIGR